MEKRIGERIAQCRHMDWAVLYMRLFAGGMMFFHNIGKIQDYNEIVNSYPSFAFAGSPAVFVIVSLVEVVRHPDNHGPVGAGIGHRHGRGNPRGVALGRPGLRDAGIHLAGGLCFSGHVRRRAVRIRHGPFPCETKKLNEENNIIWPAGRYVSGNVVTLSRFVFI